MIEWTCRVCGHVVEQYCDGRGLPERTGCDHCAQMTMLAVAALRERERVLNPEGEN